MFEWFADLSPLARYGAALLFLGAGGVAYVCGWWVPWLWAVGGTLLLAAMLVKD